jgi:SlyX protein
MNESRLTDLESTLAFQERTIQDLSDVICRQQQDIDGLAKQVKMLVEKMEQAEAPDDNGGEDESTVPPHY